MVRARRTARRKRSDGSPRASTVIRRRTIASGFSQAKVEGSIQALPASHATASRRKRKQAAISNSMVPPIDARSAASISSEIGRAHVELQSLMRTSYAVFCLKKKKQTYKKLKLNR